MLLGDRIPGPCCDGKVIFVDDDGATFVHYDNGDEALLLFSGDKWDAVYFPHDRFVRPERTKHLQPDDRITASWESEWFYPGVVRFVNPRSGRVLVRFDDGSYTIAKSDQINPMQLPVDGVIQCRVQDGDVYFPARITKKNGDRFFVEYDNPRLGGEWVATAQIRISASAFAEGAMVWVDVFSVN